MKNRKLTIKKIKKKIKQQFKIDKSSKHMETYKLQENNDYLYLKINKILVKPKLYTTEGLVKCKVINKIFSTTFKFHFDDIEYFEGIQTKLYILDGNKEIIPINIANSKIENYNNIKFIHYTNDFIYYFRNTANLKGRIILQKKKREPFENETYHEMIKQVYNEVKESELKYIVLYEKNGNRFEESSSKIFKQISHYPNVFYVLSKNSEKYDELCSRFPGKIITQEDRKFFEIIFQTKYFIGTEVPTHIMTLRTPYVECRNVLLNPQKHKFIFLQHGVMFALSMKPASRNSFKKGHLHDPYKVVVSSDLEAEHLKQYGFYDDNDLWKTGLATFDNKKIDSDACDTTIMLTWRPWDEQLDSFEDTTYYKAVKSIVDRIPNKEKLNVVLHPKVVELISDNNELLKYCSDQSIDEIINRTKVLITDYSSISFDAFYRGCHVIFWWVEKDECLRKYNNHLMLTEDNIFGPIIYDNSKIASVLKYEKNNPIIDSYKQNFKKIVEFDDNKNTLRIIDKLKKSGVLTLEENFDYKYICRYLKNQIKDEKLREIYDNVLKCGALSDEEYKYVYNYREEFLCSSLIMKLHFVNNIEQKKAVFKEMYESISDNSVTQ